MARPTISKPPSLLEAAGFVRRREKGGHFDDTCRGPLPRDLGRGATGFVIAIDAQSHARSDAMGELDYDVETSIREAIGPGTLFVGHVPGFAEETLERLKRDHAFFVRDREHGAVGHLMKSYR